jgi:hypothetical protein
MSGFEPATLAALRDVRVVGIATSRSPDQPPRDTLIWIVVDDADRVFVRSVRGTRGRWYRDLVANPRGALSLDGDVLNVRAELASDPERVAACSRAFEVKYPRAGASLASMLAADTLETTLELHPA